MTDQLSREHIAYLSKSALAFVDVQSSDDLYQQIAELLKTFIGDAIVLVSSFDSETRVLEQRAIVGVPTSLIDMARRMGFRLTPLRMEANPEAIEQIESGRLTRIEEGFYELWCRKVPRVATEAMERLARIRECYGMGCVAGGRCFGGIVVCLRGDATLPPVEVLETFVYQAAVALKRYEAERALRQSETRYRMLMERASDPYTVTTSEGVIIEANESSCSALGYTRDELIGEPISKILDPEELAANPIAWDMIRQGETLTSTRRMRRSDGTFITYELHEALLPEGDVLFSARDVTQRRKLARAVIEAEERERQAVGRDLHDSLGQQLAAIGFLSGALERRLEMKHDGAAADAEQIGELVREAVVQTRRMAHGLCPIDMSEDGLVAALNQLVVRLRAASGVAAEMNATGRIHGISREVARHLYQIAQEAANNAVRHGYPQHVTISIHVGESRGRLTVWDDGCGFCDDTKGDEGLGLRTMRYRAEMIDGALKVQSGEEGTTILCSFPCSEQG